MTSPIDNTGPKRKRSPSDNAGQSHNPQHQIPQHMMSAQPGNPSVFPQINYLVSSHKKLKLMEGDSDTFKDVLAMIDDYEGVLKRHESLAANLGAKLVGPLLLKSFDKMFHGDIQVVHSSFGLEQSPATWLDLVTLARSNPVDFVLTDSISGLVCRVYLKGGQVQISEDDYRLIMSGAPERMIPSQTIPEDEAAELGTLSILEARLAVLIKKADVVASKARQLNYHLGKHKTAVQGRSASVAGGPGFGRNSPGQLNHAPFQHDTTKLQQELLKQFTANDNRPLTGHKSARSSFSAPQDIQRARSTSNNPIDLRDQTNHHRNSSSISNQGARDDYRAIMTSKIEKLPRGDPINPPCDRCRRLKFDCTKNLTACTACTKKHAKCSWNDITGEELTVVQRGSNAMDPFINMNTNGNANGNGRVNSTVNTDANLDPNLGNPNLAAVLAGQEFSNHNTAAVAQMESLGGS